MSVRAAAGYEGRPVTLSFRARDQLSPTVWVPSLAVTDAAGATVAAAALGTTSAVEWQQHSLDALRLGRRPWRGHGADLAGNAVCLDSGRCRGE